MLIIIIIITFYRCHSNYMDPGHNSDVTEAGFQALAANVSV